MDFESPQAADVAVRALQAQGVQAQMAKVTHPPRVYLLSEIDVVIYVSICRDVFCDWC